MDVYLIPLMSVPEIEKFPAIDIEMKLDKQHKELAEIDFHLQPKKSDKIPPY